MRNMSMFEFAHYKLVLCPMNPSQPCAIDEPDATRSSAFLGELDEPDMSMGMAEMFGSNTTLLGLDNDLNLECSIERDDKTTDKQRGRNERLI